MQWLSAAKHAGLTPELAEAFGNVIPFVSAFQHCSDLRHFLDHNISSNIQHCCLAAKSGGFKPAGLGHSVSSLHVLPVSVWVYSNSLLQSKDTRVRVIVD